MKRAKAKVVCKRVAMVWSQTMDRYVLTHRCVLLVDCPTCGAKKGYGCVGSRGFTKSDVHWYRAGLVSPQARRVFLVVQLLVRAKKSLWTKRRGREHLKQWAPASVADLNTHSF